MCLVTRQIKPKVLKKDLIVFKAVHENNEEVVSRYYRFTWKKGVLEETEMKTLRCHFQCAEKFDDVVYQTYVYKKGLFTEVSEGFHAFKTKARYPYVTIREFLIPKGSLYFEDKSGLIVSNQMMLL